MKPMQSMDHDACAICHKKPCICHSSIGKILIIIVVLALVMSVGYWTYTSSLNTDMISKDGIIKKNTIMTHDIMQKDPMVKKHDEKMTGIGEWTKEEMKAMEKDHMMMSGADMKDDMMMKIDSYLPYDEKILTESLKSGKKVALFFHANWCPTCRNLDENINKELSTIPADTMIFKVNYDDSDSLKQRYGVTSQSVTLVLNTDGSVKSRKIGARNVADIFN